MAPPARRVMVTGVGDSLPAILAARLEERDDIDLLVGVDVRDPPEELRRTELVRVDLRNALIARILTEREIDSVVHAGAFAGPGEAGGRDRMKEVNVIGAMQLMAACQAAPTVRRVVVKSSTAVYGSGHDLPALLTEDVTPPSPPQQGYAADMVEIESYARTLDARREDLSVTILRLANLIGPRADSALAAFFRLPVVPTLLGYDPRLQLCHEDDALSVLEQAVTGAHPGTFNVAGPGVLYLSQCIALAARTPLPIPALLAGAVGRVVRRSGRLDPPPEALHFLRYGRVADITRLRDDFGYEPRYSTLAAFEDFLRGAERPAEERPGWRRCLSAALGTVHAAGT